MDFLEYNKKFRSQSSSKLVKDYLNYNAEYRKIARDVLRSRGDLTMLNSHLKVMGRQPVGKDLKDKIRQKANPFKIPSINELMRM